MRSALSVLLAVGLAGCATQGTTAAAPAAGKTFRDCPVCPEMTVIPAGSFVMGSPEGEPLRDPDETQHTVTFHKSFAISRYPITWDQWEECVRDNVCAGRDVEVSLRTGLDGKPIQKYIDHGRGNRPVVGVSWYDALVFTGWLNKEERRRGLSSGHRSRVRIRGASRHDNGVSAGTGARSRLRQFRPDRRGPRRRGGWARRLDRRHVARGFFPGECLRLVRHAR